MIALNFRCRRIYRGHLETRHVGKLQARRAGQIPAGGEQRHQQRRIEQSVTANQLSGSASVSESGSVFRKLDSDSDPDTDPDGFRFSIAVGAALTGQRYLRTPGYVLAAAPRLGRFFASHSVYETACTGGRGLIQFL